MIRCDRNFGVRGKYYAYRKTAEGRKNFTVVRPDAVQDPDPQEWESRLLGDINIE